VGHYSNHLEISLILAEKLVRISDALNKFADNGKYIRKEWKEIGSRK